MMAPASSLPLKTDQSSLGICYLARLWELSQHNKQGLMQDAFEAEQAYIWGLLDALGLAARGIDLGVNRPYNQQG